MPTWGLALVAFGGLWLSLWRRRWRLFGAGAVAVGLASLVFAKPPDVLVDGGGLLAVRGEDGRLTFSSSRSGRFLREVWLRQAGFEPDEAEAWPSGEQSADGRLACDALGCIYRAAGQTVALVHDRAALIEDCWAAPVLVSAAPLGPRPCAGRTRVVDGRDLKRDGAHALWLTPFGVRIESVNQARGHRPWVVRPRERGRR
jgi:competence protein ComEC